MRRSPLMLFLILPLLFFFSCGGSIKTKEELQQTPTEITTVKVDLAGSVSVLNRGEEEKITGAKIKLVVDFNRNGVFEGKHSEDKIYQSATLNGVFFMKEVEIPEGGTLAELIVEKEGYAPYYNVIKLSPGVTQNLRITLLPLFKEVKPVVRSLNFAGKLLIEFPNLKLAFSPSAIEEDTALLFVSGRSYELKSEIRQVPGISQNNSLTFLTLLFTEIKNQRGEIVEFTAESTCPYGIRQKLSREAIKNIKEVGDIDKREKGCQVPIYIFTPSNPKWNYFEEGTVVDSFGREVSCDSLSENSDYWVEMCGSKEEGISFLAVAYPVREKKKQVCFVVKDENGKPIPGVLFEAVKGGFYTSSFSDDNGIARLSIPLKTNVSTCGALATALSEEGVTLKYFDPSSASTPLPLDLSSLSLKSSQSCGCLFEVEIPVAKVEAVVIARDENGNPLEGREVCLREKDFRYYGCKKTNKDGMATFKVIPDRIYTASGPGLSSLSKRISAFDRFFSLTLSNTLPKVEMEVFPKTVKVGDYVYVFLYAYDPDGNEIRLKDFTCGGERVRIIEGEDYEGALFVTGYCKLTEAGDYKVSAQVGDAFGSFKVEEAFSVVSDSSPPYLYGYNFFDDDGKLVTKDSLKVGRSYRLVFYAFDPDGDPIVYRSNNPYCSFEDDGVARCEFPAAGDYNLSFTLDDRKGNEVEESILVHVTSGEMLKLVSFSVVPSVVSSGEPVKVTGIVYAPGSSEVSATFLVDGGPVTSSEPCEEISAGYFKCSFEKTLDLGEGEHTVSLSVQGESSSVTRSSTLFAGVSNLPPKILLPLPLKLEAEVGVPFTFTVKAIDPDGDDLNYRWFVNGVEVSSGKKDYLKYTFDASGVYRVEVLVSDGKEVAYTYSQVTAVNLDAGRQFIAHFGAEGVYGVLYSDDYSYVDTEVSGELGYVYFGKLPTSGLNFAVVIPPEVIVPKEVLFKYLVSSLVKEACELGDCEEVQKEAVYWLATKEIPQEKLGSWAGKVIDENSDGFVDWNEVYRSFVSLYDADRDGKVSFKEITGKTKVKVFVIRNVKGQQYFLNDVVEQFFEGMMPFSLQESRKVSVEIENPPDSTSFEVLGADGTCTLQEGKVLCDLSVPMQDNGLFSFIIKDSSGKTFTAKDYDTSSFIVDYSEFVFPKNVDVVGFDSYEDLKVFASFAGNNYFLGEFTVDGTYSIPQHGFGNGYFVNYTYKKEYEGYAKMKWINNFFIGETLPDFIKIDQFRGELLDVDIIYHPTDREAILTGVDVSSLNAVSVFESCSLGEQTFELSLEGALEGEDVVPLPHLDKVLPPAVYSYVSSICSSTESSHYVEITVKEVDKDGLEKGFYLKKVLQ